MDSAPRAKLDKQCLDHDLANVFQVILQAASLLSVDESQRETAAIIVRAVERAEHILGLHDRKGSVSLHEGIDTAAAFTRDAAQLRSSQEMVFNVRVRETRLRIRASALERALVNLFVNVLDVGPGAGGERMTVDVDGAPVEGGYRLTISDNGPGIPSTMLNHLFAPRVSAKEEGHGLGLYVARSALSQCGATISAANGDAGGAVFTLFFPSSSVEPAAGAGAGQPKSGSRAD
jgi:signal transduction histidine kinase